MDLSIGNMLEFIERHGYAVLFFWVLAEQGAIPLPSAPLLIATGALVRSGHLNLAIAVFSAMAGALIADAVWFELGKRRGRQVLRLVCRMSLEPDSCVRQTENTFLKYGLGSLLVSKFIPGLNALAAPIAGHSRVPFLRFALYDVTGALFWSGSYLTIGYLFSHQLETVFAYAERVGSNLALLVVGILAAWFIWKYVQRRRFIKKLAGARITPAELHQRLVAEDDVLIIDLRGGVVEEPPLIPGALRMSFDSLNTRARGIPQDREVILFCS
jgi:membrane protein DedA with SNARE-associated domain